MTANGVVVRHGEVFRGKDWAGKDAGMERVKGIQEADVYWLRGDSRRLPYTVPYTLLAARLLRHTAFEVW